MRNCRWLGVPEKFIKATELALYFVQARMQVMVHAPMSREQNTEILGPLDSVGPDLIPVIKVSRQKSRCNNPRDESVWETFILRAQSSSGDIVVGWYRAAVAVWGETRSSDHPSCFPGCWPKNLERPAGRCVTYSQSESSFRRQLKTWLFKKSFSGHHHLILTTSWLLA